ncbi:hypothetical protein CEN50_23720 [Fischerella thermalis CCMEE 5268]|uniref:Clan AA aspartic protease n=1 Tax=Fischerella thermalis CCMEE 5268 TaxID=2019662 RepID=A0A2N6K9Z2_9CYAN|nr:hypothetical protein [Fischerella thermalis]PLZ95023.1 hypothetical protein CEN50_23720 [Fischerella thermalis CCMEE 5268]
MITGIVNADFEPIIPLSVYGTLLTIPVDEADSEPPVGMSLMEGYQLTMQIFEGGQVELRKVGTV